MPKFAKNCRALNMPTIKVRRSRPSSLMVALALLITMAIVYILTIQSFPRAETEAAASIRSSAELRMEGMAAQFLLSGVYDDETHAKVAAAKCALSGGAGLVLEEGDQFAVVYEAGSDFSNAEAPVIQRNCDGLTMRIDAPAEVISAASDALSILRALATETAVLANSMEKGETDGRTISALMNVYRTRLQTAADGLAGKNAAALALVHGALSRSLERTDPAAGDLDAGKIRLIHAAACSEWISLSKNLMQLGST